MKRYYKKITKVSKRKPIVVIMYFLWTATNSLELNAHELQNKGNEICLISSLIENKVQEN